VSNSDSNAIDAAIADLKSQIGGYDADIAAIQYLSGIGEQIRQTFLSVATMVDEIQSLENSTPSSVADDFERNILPALQRTLTDARRVRPSDTRLAQLHSLATRALQEDAAAFEKLVPAFRLQDQQQLAAGRALRESSARWRREWVRQALALGQSLGLYDSPSS
jgi:hypothetical protein